MQKKVEYFKDQKKKGEKMSDCDKIVMASASEYVVPIYYDCLKEMFDYEKKPVLFSQHLLFLDDRLKKGLEIYKNKGIKELVKTDFDIRAVVSSGTEKDKTYDVVLKSWLPKKLLRYRYEILEYLENLTVSCSCKDFIINGKYRNNCSIICPHIASVMWFLMQEDSMPKFLRTEEEYKKRWYENSKTVELENNIKGVSMKMFEPYLNVLALREFKNMETSVSLSIHREPNPEYKDRYPEGIRPTWITFSGPGDIERIIKALMKGMIEMLASRGNTEIQIKEAINNLIPTEDKDQKIKELDEKNKLLAEENEKFSQEILKINKRLIELEKEKRIKVSWFQKFKDFIKKIFLR